MKLFLKCGISEKKISKIDPFAVQMTHEIQKLEEPQVFEFDKKHLKAALSGTGRLVGCASALLVYCLRFFMNYSQNLSL